LIGDRNIAEMGYYDLTELKKLAEMVENAREKD
jgi:hypothetical protein